MYCFNLVDSKALTFFFCRDWLGSALKSLTKKEVRKLEKSCSFRELYFFWLLSQNVDEVLLRNYIQDRLGISDGVLVEIDISSELIDCTCDMKTLMEDNSLIYHTKKKIIPTKKQSVKEDRVGDEEENVQSHEMEDLETKFETHLIGRLRKPKLLK